MFSVEELTLRSLSELDLLEKVIRGACHQAIVKR